MPKSAKLKFNPHPPCLLDALLFIGGISTAQLAKMLGLRDPKSVRRWVRGERYPSAASRAALFALFAADVDVLLKRLPAPKPDAMIISLPRYWSADLEVSARG